RRTAQLARVADAVLPDIAANPVEVCVLGTQAVAFQPQAAANFVQQARPARGRIRLRYGGPAAVIRHIAASMPDNAPTIAQGPTARSPPKPLITVGKARLTGRSGRAEIGRAHV